MLQRLRKERRGSAMVEFALVAPLLVLLLLGIMVLGVVINAKIVVSGAAREAGRTFAVYKDDRLARAKAVEAISGGGLKAAADGQVLFDGAHDVQLRQDGNYVQVTVLYRQPTFVPLIAQLIDPSNPSGAIIVRSQATFRVER